MKVCLIPSLDNISRKEIGLLYGNATSFPAEFKQQAPKCIRKNSIFKQQ